MSLTLGCDPELVCRMNGRYTPAHNYFKSHSSMGLDGCESIAEVRPGYSESPIDLTAKIRIILEYGHNKVPKLEFLSGHYPDAYPLGGHIHVGTEPKSEIIDSLDTLLYSFSNCVDDKFQRAKREKSGYGKRKAYRRKSYGFEYRTPGSWLISPAVTLVTLTLAKLAVIAVEEDDLDLTQIKGRQHSSTFLKNLKNNLITIPDDCREGLKEMDSLLTQRIMWDQNILPNWGFQREAA